MDSISHEIDTIGVLRGMMISMELNLAHKAPHDVVMLDGSFASLVIYLNQGLQNLESCGQGMCSEFLSRWNSGLPRSGLPCIPPALFVVAVRTNERIVPVEVRRTGRLSRSGLDLVGDFAFGPGGNAGRFRFPANSSARLDSGRRLVGPDAVAKAAAVADA